MDMQKIINETSEKWAKERSETQMTLGELIIFFKAMPKDMLIEGLGELDSYRGYYRDLAFEPLEGTRTVEDLLKECVNALSKEFEGYKGGEYFMSKTTPLWVAHYGSCGPRLMDVTNEGKIVASEEIDS